MKPGMRNRSDTSTEFGPSYVADADDVTLHNGDVGREKFPGEYGEDLSPFEHEIGLLRPPARRRPTAYASRRLATARLTAHRQAMIALAV